MLCFQLAPTWETGNNQWVKPHQLFTSTSMIGTAWERASLVPMATCPNWLLERFGQTNHITYITPFHSHIHLSSFLFEVGFGSALKIDLVDSQFVNIDTTGFSACMIRPESCSEGGTVMLWLRVLDAQASGVVIRSATMDPSTTTGFSIYMETPTVIV